MKKKILVIGGVAGGASAAARLRRHSEEDQIIMFEKGHSCILFKLFTSVSLKWDYRNCWKVSSYESRKISSSI